MNWITRNTRGSANGIAYGSPLVIWVQSFCRSTLATYLEIKAQYPGSVYVIVLGPPDPEFRARMGFKSKEFDISKLYMLDPCAKDACDFLDSMSNGIHMFTAYHKSRYPGSKLFGQLLSRAIANGQDYFIASEAPQNMEGKPLRSILKEFYIRYVLKRQLSEVIRNALFILSYSGSLTERLVEIGWPVSKVEPFGYFPPSLKDAVDLASSVVSLPSPDKGRLTLLLSGVHSAHKSPMTLIDACELLCRRGYRGQLRVLIVGSGEQTEGMLQRCKAASLPIEFLGFLSLGEVVAVHSIADVYVATGVSEPWGIRVNDALNLACPAIVSSGMGAADLVRDTGFGWCYDAGSAHSLAEVICQLIEDPSMVSKAKFQLRNSNQILPSAQAGRFLDILYRRLTLHQHDISPTS